MPNDPPVTYTMQIKPTGSDSKERIESVIDLFAKQGCRLVAVDEHWLYFEQRTS